MYNWRECKFYFFHEKKIKRGNMQGLEWLCKQEVGRKKEIVFVVPGIAFLSILLISL